MCCAFGPGSIASRGLLFGAEAASKISAPEWDVLSGRGFKRKLYPGFDARNGIRFPVEASNGKCVPEYGFSVGCIFRLGLQTESASRNPRLEWDALSGTALNRKLRLGIDARNGMRFPLGLSAENVSRNQASEWDALSGTVLNRKLCPRIDTRNGICFPERPSSGNCIPF